MASNEKKKSKNPLVGHQAKPMTLDNTTKLDVDTNKTIVDDIINFGLTGGLNTNELEKFTSISNSRDQIYTIIDTMAQDSAVSSIIKTYADCACEVNDNGHIVWCESKDPKISKYVNYLLSVINVDKKVYGWAYCLVKYGDVYLRLYRESDYSDKHFDKTAIDNAYYARNVLNESAKRSAIDESVNLNVHLVSDPYSLYVDAVADPGTMYELTKLGTSYGYIETPNTDAAAYNFSTFGDGTNSGVQFANYKMKSNDVNVYQADDFVHACLEDDFSRFPETVELYDTNKDYAKGKNASTYKVRRGKSLLIDKYKVWREKQLLENAILLNRLTKSSVVRPISVDVGDMPKEQVAQVLRRVKELFEQKSSYKVGESFSEYNNPGPMENNIYYATHNGQGKIDVATVGGDVDVKNLADLDSWVNKFYAGFGVPKAYFGYTDDGAGFNGGESLAIISSQFGKGVSHVQSALTEMMTDMINLILVNKGLKAYLNNFTIKMKTPLTSEQVKSREDLTNRIQAVSSMNSLFTEIEDKGRRLEILKSLVSMLNFGDDLVTPIDQEIAAVKEKEAEERRQAEEEAKAAEAEAESENEQAEEEPSLEKVAEPGEDEDLGNSAIAPMEGFRPNAGATPLAEDVDALVDEDFLPTAEDLHKDFVRGE